MRNGAPAAVCGGCGISREVATAGPEGRAAASAALAAHQRGLLNGQQEDEDEYNDTSQTNGDSTTQNRQLDQFENDQENEEIIRNSSLVNDGSQQEPGKYS
uniref:Uncharacterized protein n=1 Tax=Heterosigma akashiwo TaxID=2829 RepID=A0A7S3XX12_HETAK